MKNGFDEVDIEIAIDEALQNNVIPEVVRSLPERRTGSEKDFEMITNCPICDSVLIKKEGQVDYYCINPNCPARKIESLIHFVSRKAMNIEAIPNPCIKPTIITRIMPMPLNS